MKDIPMFTTEDGVSTLLLKEIPYKETAYVRVRSVQPGKLGEHLAECASFCRMAGAERVYATGHDDLADYPLHTIVYRMHLALPQPGESQASLWPVTEETVTRWRRIYNERMASVDNAATLTAHDEKEIVTSGGAYFVHQDGKLLGIGWVKEHEIAAVASVMPGMGRRVMQTLCQVCWDNQIFLEVASTNHRAIRLYEKMGFLKTGEVSRWYKIR